MQPQFIPTFSDAGSLVDSPLPPEPQPQNSASEPETEDEQEPVEPEVVESEAVDTEPVDDIEGLGIVDVPPISDEDLIADLGVEPVFSTSEAAEFFDKTSQWLYWGMRPDRKTGEIPFTYEDGTPIRPDRGDDEVRGRRQFTLPLVKDILMASYRRGNVEPEELKQILRRIYIARQGGEWRRDEGWHLVNVGRNRRRWVHPDRCEVRDGRWVMRKTTDIVHAD